jgi:hypothetical protein
MVRGKPTRPPQMRRKNQGSLAARLASNHVGRQRMLLEWDPDSETLL